MNNIIKNIYFRNQKPLINYEYIKLAPISFIPLSDYYYVSNSTLYFRCTRMWYICHNI